MEALNIEGLKLQIFKMEVSSKTNVDSIGFKLNYSKLEVFKKNVFKLKVFKPKVLNRQKF